MKFPFRLFLLISSGFILCACSNLPEETKTALPVESAQVPAAISDDSLIVLLSRHVLNTLKTEDYKTFASFIHPVWGIRFSPYGYIDTVHDLKFTHLNFVDRMESKNKFSWGNYDGSGDAIQLSAEDYFLKFVYNADFLNAEKTSLNKMIGAGNSLNNLETVYKDCPFTESYFSGFDKKYEGMDWCSLRLVFKKHLDKFYLVGIVHDQWTI